MTKPRDSILLLFDPLEAPCTPQRNSSPDSGSDKENERPKPGELTTFFNRIYTIPKHGVPKTPKGKLIDFGNTTLMEGDSDEGDVTALPIDPGSNDEEDDTLDLKAVLSSPEAQRPPLAEIDLEGEATPKARHIHRHTPKSIPSSKLNESSTSSQPITAAPVGSPLSAVINDIILSSVSSSVSTKSINEIDFSSLTLSESTGPLTSVCFDEAFSEDEDEFGPDSCGPLINVCPPELPKSSRRSLTSPIVPTHNQSPVGLHHSVEFDLPTRASENMWKANRTSIHLQESFNMHMQSPDLSFDLLNDKVSFMSGPQDSFWAEDMDLAAAEAEMEEQARRYEDAERHDHSRDTFIVSIPANALGSHASIAAPDQVMKNDGVTEGRRPVFSLPAKELHDEPPNHGDVMTSSPTDSAIASSHVEDIVSKNNDDADFQPLGFISQSLVSKPRASLESNSSGATQVAPSHAIEAKHITPVRRETKPRSSTLPSVPALRIVKKTFKLHSRTESSGSSGSAASTTSTAATTVRSASSGASIFSRKSASRTNSLDVPAAQQSSVRPQQANNAPLLDPASIPQKTTVRGAERQPVPGIARASGGTFPAVSSSGPARVPIARSAVGNPQRTVPAAGIAQTRPAVIRQATGHKPISGSGPVRPTAASLSKGSARSAVSGLQPPSRVVSTAASSALPVPASRLAQPSTGFSRSISNTMRSLKGPFRAPVNPATVAPAPVPTSRFGIRKL